MTTASISGPDGGTGGFSFRYQKLPNSSRIVPSAGFALRLPPSKWGGDGGAGGFSLRYQKLPNSSRIVPSADFALRLPPSKWWRYARSSSSVSSRSLIRSASFIEQITSIRARELWIFDRRDLCS